MRTSSVITGKIAAARRRHGVVSFGTGAGAAMLFVFTCLGAGLLVDLNLELSWLARLGLLIVYVLGGAALLAILAVRPVMRGPDDEEIALAVERFDSTFATRLIAAVQFSRLRAAPAGMHEGMIRALILQAEEMAGPVKFERIYPTKRMWRLIGGAMGVLVVLSTCVIASGAVGTTLLKRAALLNVPLPHATYVEVVDGDRVVVRGDGVSIVAVAKGVLPEKGTVRLQFASGAVQKFDLVRLADQPSRYELNVGSVLEPFTYSVNVNDGWSDRAYSVAVVDRPEIVSLGIRQVFPAYTKLGTAVKQPGDLNLLTGSSLILDIRASTPLARTPVNGKISHLTLNRTGPVSAASNQPAPEFNTDIPLVLDPADASKLTSAGPLLIPAGTVGMTVHLVDPTGMENKDPALYRIILTDDKPPVLLIRSPSERSETVTRRAFVPIGFSASDDFGIVTLRVHYRVLAKAGDAEKAAGGDNEVAAPAVDSKDNVIDLDLGSNPLAVKGIYRLQLSKLRPQPVEGDLIEWWLEAVDGNDATGPGRTLTEVYRASVVSESDKRNELLTRFGDAGDSFTDLAETQQKLNEQLGGEIMSREPATQPHP